MAKDPVCGMQVSEQPAKATAEHKGQKFYFCSTDCKAKHLMPSVARTARDENDSHP